MLETEPLMLPAAGSQSSTMTVNACTVHGHKEEQNRKENATPFSVDVPRSLLIYWAAHDYHVDINYHC